MFLKNVVLNEAAATDSPVCPQAARYWQPYVESGEGACAIMARPGGTRHESGIFHTLAT